MAKPNQQVAETVIKAETRKSPTRNLYAFGIFVSEVILLFAARGSVAIFSNANRIVLAFAGCSFKSRLAACFLKAMFMINSFAYSGTECKRKITLLAELKTHPG